MKRCIILYVPLILLLSSCGSAGKITKRYKSASSREMPADSIKLWTGINAYIFEVDKPSAPSPKTIFDLSPQGQKEFEKAIRQYEKKSDDFLSKISKNVSAGKQESPGFIDYTKFQKRIVVSILDKNYFLADRLARFRITFTTSDANIKITACDKIVTKYETVDVGKQDYTNVGTASITGTLGGSSKVTGSTGTSTDAASNNGTGTTSGATTEVNTSNGISGTLGNTKTFFEEVFLKDRYVAVSGYVTKSSVTLYEESVSGIRLTGNLIADISFEFDKEKAVKKAYVPGNLIKDGWVVHPDSIEIQDLFVYYPNIDNDITMTYTYEPLVRHVESGDATISESDDVVTLLHKEVTAVDNVILLPKEQFEPKLWVIKSASLSLSIKSPVSAAAGIMYFDSYDKARSFLIWLRRCWNKVSAAGNKLVNSAYQLDLSDRSSLTGTFVKDAQVTYFK